MTRDKIKEKVSNYVDSKWDEILPYVTVHDVPKEIREHVINISVSILCTKWGVSYGGGSFVQAICDNDLGRSFWVADNINERLLKFYVKLLNNFSHSNL